MSFQEGDEDDIEVEFRNVHPHPGWLAERTVMTYKEFSSGRKQPVGQKTIGVYSFACLDHDRIADYIEGDLDELEDHADCKSAESDADGNHPRNNPVIYIGDNFGKHYFQSQDTSEIPEDVLAKLEEKGLTLYENVDGGWKNWEGRPEWSDNYIDFSEAERVF